MGSEHSTGMSNHIRKAGQNPFPPFALISERGEVGGREGGEGSTQSKHSRAHHKGGETSSKTRTQSAYAKGIFRKKSLVS